MSKQIIVSLSVIAVIAAVAVGGTVAYFSDTETSTGNTITAGSLDLTLNGYNGEPVAAVVMLEDMKPSQTWYSGPITLDVFNNPGRIYKHIVNEQGREIVCVTGALTEPECVAESGYWNNGECFQNFPVDYLPDVTWFDLEVWEDLDGDGVIDEDEWVVLIPDADELISDIASLWIYLGTYGYPQMTNEIVIRQSFHIDGVLAGNEYQGDSCTFTEEFMVLQTNAPHPDSVYVPSQNVTLDSIDVGDSDSVSMTAHNAQGWFDDPKIGGYGGRDGDGMGAIAMIGGDDDDNGTCDAYEDWATFEMNAGSETADTLIIRHLDGSANDSFDVYVDDVLVGNYVGNQYPGEVWVTTSFDLGGQAFSGQAIVKLVITGNYPWALCSTYGQGAVNWAKITN